MNLIDTLNQFVNSKKKSINDEELNQMIKYSISDTYLSNTMDYDSILEYICTDIFKNNTPMLYLIHSKNMINLIIPEYSTRICCNKQLINNIPFFKCLLYEDWCNKDNIFSSSFYYNNEEIIGATNIIVKNELESIIFEKPYEFTYNDIVKNNNNDYQLELKNVKLENLHDLLHHYNKKRSINNILKNKSHNLNIETYDGDY